MVLFFFMLLCSCLPIHGADIQEEKSEKRDFTAQLALLKDMWRAPDGYTYLTTAKVHDTRYLLVYQNQNHNKLKIKEVNEKGVFEVREIPQGSGHRIRFHCISCSFQQEDSCPKLKTKFTYCKDKETRNSYAFLTYETWSETDLDKNPPKLPKKDLLELFNDTEVVNKS